MRLPRKCDYQESVTTRQTDGQTDAGQSDPYVPLGFAGDTIRRLLPRCIHHFKLDIRHGPFHYQGGGGGLGFRSRPRYFFQTKSEQDFFFRRPDFFFINKKLHLYNIGFRDYFMHTSGFCDNFMLSRQPHT